MDYKNDNYREYIENVQHYVIALDYLRWLALQGEKITKTQKGYVKYTVEKIIKSSKKLK